MRVAIDPGDVLGDGCWETVKRVLVVASTLWVGALAAIVAFFAGEAVGMMWIGAWGDLPALMLKAGETTLWAMILAPFYLLTTVWGFVLIPVMGVVMYTMFRTEKDVTWVWYSTCVLVGLVALKGMLLDGSGIMAVSWAVFIFLQISLGTGCWFLNAWRSNEQARHLMRVFMENEARRAELGKKFGTKTFGQGNLQDFDDE